MKCPWPAFGLILALSACTDVLPKADAGGNVLALKAEADQAYAAQDFATAEQRYVELARQGSADAESWIRLGNIYARSERADQAIQAYRESLLRNPENPKAWHNLGILHLRQALAASGELTTYTTPGDGLHEQAQAIRKSLQEILQAPAADAAVPPAPAPQP